MTKYKKLIVTMVVVCAVCALLGSGSVDASGINFEVADHYELVLPEAKYLPTNSLVQYGYWNNDRKMYDKDGHKVDGPGTDTYVGITKYARAGEFESFPGVGWMCGVIIPEIRIKGSSVSLSGIGDPYLFWLAMFNPTPKSTFGVEYFVQTPIGNDEVTNDYWAHIFNFWYGVNMGKVDFSVELGGVFRSDRKKSGEHDLNPGDTFYTNVRLGYRITKLVEPFVAFDHERTGRAIDEVTREKVTGPDAFMLKSDSHEMTLGAGLIFYLKDTLNLSMRYSRSIDGKNTIVTDTIHARLIYFW